MLPFWIVAEHAARSMLVGASSFCCHPNTKPPEKTPLLHFRLESGCSVLGCASRMLWIVIVCHLSTAVVKLQVGDGSMWHVCAWLWASISGSQVERPASPRCWTLNEAVLACVWLRVQCRHADKLLTNDPKKEARLGAAVYTAKDKGKPLIRFSVPGKRITVCIGRFTTTRTLCDRIAISFYQRLRGAPHAEARRRELSCF